MKKPLSRLLSPALLLTALSAIPPAAADVPFQALTTWWNFNNSADPAKATDLRRNLTGTLMEGAAYTEDAGGRTGAAGDRAMSFTGNGVMDVAEGDFLNAVTENDTITISFWQKKNGTPNSSAFWAYSPSSVNGERGMQAHVPWGDGTTIYFDTAGCCDGTQRVNGPPIPEGFDWSQWHHFVFVKNADIKEVWVDGELTLTITDQAPLPQDFYRLTIGRAPDTGSMEGEIDDFAIYSAALGEADILKLAAGQPPTAVLDLTDSDGDGLPDSWERIYFPNDLTKLKSGQDFDTDGLPDELELVRNTLPNNPDTDGDGLKDGVETNTGNWVSATDTGTDPLEPDTDGDGLKDGVETKTGIFVNAANTGTSPHLADSDTDGFGDAQEVLYASNPNVAASTPILADAPTLLAWWKFNDATDPAKAVDTRAGLTGVLNDEAAYTADAEGRSGTAGDRALSVFGGGGMELADASFLNVGSAVDRLTFSFWQKRADISASNTFWAYSKSSLDSERGAQVHLPWNDGTIYFDTGGAGNAALRLSGRPPVPQGEEYDWSVWHHFALVKNKEVKEVWIDGERVLASTTAQEPLANDFYRLLVGRGMEPSINGELDDFAIFAAALSEVDIKRLAAGQSPESLGNNEDTDGDGLIDAWETLYFPGDLTKLASGQDFDQDGLTDEKELTMGTIPNNPDTDGDGLKDGVETNTGTWSSATNTGTNPKLADTDGDGLSDGAETNTGAFVSAANTGTNPFNRDSDGDGFSDPLEIRAGTDPTKSASVPFPAGTSKLLAWWNFNTDDGSGSVKDAVSGIEGIQEGDAAYSEDAGGRTEAAGDKSMTFTGGQYINVEDGWFLNLTAPGDAITISLWQRLNSVLSSSSFWGYSTSSADNERGIQAHLPWGDGQQTIYFDHAGCCGGTQRISAPATDLDTFVWNHFAFVKNGSVKEIWINGELFHMDAEEDAAPLPEDFYRLAIGGGPGVTSIDGNIDDFAVFGGGLTEAQIKALAAGGAPDTVLGGTPPPAGGFAITAITVNPDKTVTVTWQSVAGTNYTIEISENLTAWTPLQLQIPAAQGNSATFTVPALANTPLKGFLRVRTKP